MGDTVKTTADIEQLSYKELQKIAKENGIAANQKKDILIEKIKEMYQNIENQISEAPLASHDPKPQQQEEIAISREEEIVVTQSVTESVVHDKNSPEIFPSPQKADLSFEQVEEETDENSEETYGDEEIENTDPIENRLGGKLLGVATPTGQKQLFNSPMLSKSGQKVYEKYNVHWRYEDYDQETNPTSLITPKKSEEVEEESTPMSLGSYLNDEGEVYESPEKRVGSDKLLGLPTPNGKSIYFLTPKDKICDQYNVHWRYEDYLNDDNPPPIPPPPTSSVQPFKPSAITPRSEGKFKFVHSHP